MLVLRKKIAQYQEIFYLLYILPMVGLISAGFNSEDRFYRIVFFVATFFLLIKMAVTDFTRREILWIAVITLLLGLNFLKNGEKTLIMTAMGLFGAKNVSLEKVFRSSFWLKLVLTAGTLSLAAAGIIENKMTVLPKNGVDYTLYCYGYLQPNATYANLFVLFFTAVLVWKDKLKWYAYIGFTLILWAAYKVLMCRTGFLVWLVFMLIILAYKLSCRMKFNKIYMFLVFLIPSIVAFLSFLLPLIGMYNAAFLETIDFYLTGRIWHLIQGWNHLDSLFLGRSLREPFDNSYYQLVVNYGWIISAFCFVAYLRAVCLCIKGKRDYEALALSVMSIYGFMEFWPLSVGWNVSLLLLAPILFGTKSRAVS